MDPLRHIARPLLAGIFIAGGLDALRHPEAKAELAEEITEPVGDVLDVHLPATTWVRINGGTQVLAGLALVTSVVPRVASLVLAGSLGFTTAAGHPFWKQENEPERSHQRIQFLKNMAIIGGLLEASLDRGGRPSVMWSAGHRLHEASESLHDTLAA